MDELNEGLNVLQIWEKWHWQNVFREIRDAGIDLNEDNIERIIKLMSFEQRSKRNPDLCPPYYSIGQSCYPSIEDLNCMLCACPNYDSSRLEGGCRSNSPQGKMNKHKNLPAGQVWDCSACPGYHSPGDIRKYLKQNLSRLRIMSEKILQETEK